MIREVNPYRGVIFTTAWDGILVRISEWASVPREVFPLGKLYATPAALKVIPRSEIATALRRHAAGECGPGGSIPVRAEVPGVGEILSSHRSAAGRDFCVATEVARSQTMVYLEGEF
jgi:hypothetical protein